MSEAAGMRADFGEIGGERPNTIIESLGIHLPERFVATDEVLAGCRRPIRFPLEQTTGIRTRGVAAPGEFAIDFAMEASRKCLARSRRDPSDIDLVIACNISRYDGPNQFWCEPGTATRLAGKLGLAPERAFDLSNACAGMFTGIAVADAYLSTGRSRLALVVSGEVITHLTTTAQREIQGFMDSRLACLTLGDAGAAVLLEVGQDGVAGFHEIDIYTLGELSRACIAQVSDRPAGGAIMLTDVVKLSGAAVAEAVAHAVQVQARAGWPPELLDHLIMHQTSERTISEAATLVDRTYGRRVTAGWNVASVVGRVGNTASTSHFVAFHDDVLAGRIASGDNILFSINGSGLTIGTAVYTCDDLPDRLRAGPAPARSAAPPRRAAAVGEGRLAIERDSLTVLGADQSPGLDTLDLGGVAAETCLQSSRVARRDIDLLVFTGVYRTRFLSEPAIAALLAGLLQINHRLGEERRTLCFDILNGGAGFLTACDVAATLLASRNLSTALIVGAEIDPKRQREAGGWRPEPTASAAILTRGGKDGRGLGPVTFAHAPQFADDFVTYCELSVPGGQLVVRRSPDFEAHAAEAAAAAVRRELAGGGATPDAIMTSQISPVFLADLGHRLRDVAPVIDVLGRRGDLATSSLPAAFAATGLPAGSSALLVEVGAGLQTALARYHV